MQLFEKIIAIYPELGEADNIWFFEQTIILQDDMDGNGPYIAKWEHPTLPKPTENQLLEQD